MVIPYKIRTCKQSWIMLGCAWLLGFAMYCPFLCIPPIALMIKENLGVSHAAVGLLFSLPLGVLVFLAIPSGLLADRVGTQKAVGIGAIVMAAGSLTRGVIRSYDLLLASTVLYGVGFSIIYPNLPKIVGLWFPRETVGLATGVYTTGITTGAAIALAITLPVILPLTHTIQGVFLFWSIPAVVAAVLWWIVAQDPPLAPGSHLQGSVMNRTESAPYSLWKDKNMWVIAFMLFVNNLHFYTWSGWGPALMTMKGASPDLGALIASFRGWVGLPTIFLMPWVSYKVGLRKPFIWGSAFLLAIASWSAIYISVPMGWPLMAMVGIATGGTFPMILGFLLEMLPNRSVGTAAGVVLSIGYIGGPVGPWLAGYVVDSTGSLDFVLVLLGVMAIIWAFFGLLLPETGCRPPVPHPEALRGMDSSFPPRK